MVPEIAMLLMLAEELVVFESVTVCALLVVLTVWLGKLSEVGETLTDPEDVEPVYS